MHLFTSMDPPMLFINVGPHELLATVLALEGFVTSVDDPVLTKIGAQGEPLSAFHAFERFFIRRMSA